jgi:integrase
VHSAAYATILLRPRGSLFLLSAGARIDEALRLDRGDWEPARMRVIGKGDRERGVHHREGLPRDRGLPRGTHGPLPRARLTVQGANHICRQLAQRLGVTRFRPCQLRHALGTFLRETMGDARLTAETLGHRGLASVSGYTKITDTRRREAYEQLQRRGL